MKNIYYRSLLTIGCASALALTACGGGSGGGGENASDNGSGSENTGQVCTTTQGLTAGNGPRLYLTSNVVSRLQARAKSGDAEWSELQQRCEALTTATIHPPSGPAYASPDLGSGYQGEEYLPAIASLGLCYQATQGVDDAAAAKYADAGERVLLAMSTPESAGGQRPSTDSGYGIRNYGVGMALGYDWLYPELSEATRQQVIGTLNTWVDWYDQSGFLRDDPIGNYFVGYFLAKTLTALGTEGDNPKAASYWQDVNDRLWGELVQPQYSTYLAGGGWPEGWGYGPRAVRGVAEVLWAVKTAKDLDWYSELPQTQQSTYVSHFAWPALNRMDDQGTVRSGNPLEPSASLASALATVAFQMNDAHAPRAAAFAADLIANGEDDRRPWEKFLFWDPQLPQTSYTDGAASHFAPGPGHVAMRSDWSRGATWAALAGGSYINAADSGEQMFNAGSFSVVLGSEPVIVNPTGWLPHTAGTAGEELVYDDSWGARTRKLYNTFFVADASNPYSPGQNSAGPDQSNAHLEHYEDTGNYVRVRAMNLEDQYGAGASKPVSQFTRDLVFVRPGTFVAFDRTTVANAGADQWIAYHTPVAPTQQGNRFDVAGRGSVSVLLPQGADTKTVSLPGGTTRIEARAPVAQASQQWLSVVTSGSTPTQKLLSPENGNVLNGDAVGVHLAGARNQVVLFAADHSATGNLSSVEYRVAQTADADHILVDMAPSASGYSVNVSQQGGELVVRVSQGGSYQVTADGTLGFEVSQSGAVSESPEPTTPAASEDPTAQPGGEPGTTVPGEAVKPEDGPSPLPTDDC